MLQNWLSPVSKDIIKTINSKEQNFGKRLNIYKNIFPDLSQTRVAIIGIDEIEANQVRQALYPMNFPYKTLKIADLGNVRKTEVTFVIPVLKELIDGGIIPIIIGKNVDFTLSQLNAYKGKGKAVNLTLIDEKIQYNNSKKTPAFLNKVLKTKTSPLFHLSLLGYQMQYVSTNKIKTLERKNFEHVRLGKIRSNIEEAEPLIRDADLLSFNIAAMRQAEAPGQIDPTPSGFFTEEACKLCRYAGMNDKLTSFGLYGFHADHDLKNQTAQVLAQIIWYFIDGYFYRKNDYPVTTDSLIEYIVNFKQHDYQITFWKSKKSGRWWMQVPVKTKKKVKRHQLVPCSYQDYQMACREDLPERLLNAYRRFS